MAKRDSQVCFSSTSSAMKFLYLFLKVDFISNPRDNSANIFNCLIIAESTCYDYIYLLNLTTLRSVAILDAPCDITRQLTLFNKKHTCFVIVTFEFLEHIWTTVIVKLNHYPIFCRHPQKYCHLLSASHIS